MKEADPRPFYVYVDELQSFTTLALANMLSELRKFGVGMVLAHQYPSQLDPAIRDAVLGNGGTLIAFRLGAGDAGLIAREFEPVFDRIDLLNLPNHDTYLKLMIDGTPSKPYQWDDPCMSPDPVRATEYAGPGNRRVSKALQAARGLANPV